MSIIYTNNAILSLEFDETSGTLIKKAPSCSLRRFIPFGYLPWDQYFYQRHLNQMTAAIIKNLDFLESVKKIKTDHQLDNRLAVNLETAKVIQSLVKKSIGEKEAGLLENRILALEYRVKHFDLFTEQVSHTNKDESELLLHLTEQAGRWKKGEKQKGFSPGKGEELTMEDKFSLQILCTRYPKMAKLLLDHPDLRHDFFTWTFQDHNSVDTFVLYPGKQELLTKCTLATRTGRIHNSGICALKIQYSEIDGLDLTLPFQECARMIDATHPVWKTRRISILDLNKKVKLGGSDERTIQQIFKVFSEKISLEVMGNFEWSPVYEQASKEQGSSEECGGITPWNCWSQSTHGPTPFVLDPTQKDWIETLPGFEKLSEREIRKRYRFDNTLTHADGQLRGDLTPGVPFVSARISFRPDSKKNNEALSGQQHGSFQIGIPDLTAPANYPHWRIYHFGAFVPDNPGAYAYHWWKPFKQIAKGLANLRFAMNTVPGVISTIDENRYKNFRQHSGYTFVISPQECQALIEHLGADIKAAQTKNFPFSYTSLSCSEYSQTTLTKIIKCRLSSGATFPDLFKVNIRQISNPFPVSLIVRMVNAPGKLTSELSKDRLLRFCLAMFTIIGCGPYRAMTIRKSDGRIIKISIADTESWRTMKLHMPTMLFQRMDKETGRFRGQKI